MFSAADEQPKDARNVISNATVQNPQRLPLGPNSRVIGTFTPQPEKGPVKLVLERTASREAVIDGKPKAVLVVHGVGVGRPWRHGVTVGDGRARELDGARSGARGLLRSFYRNSFT